MKNIELSTGKKIDIDRIDLDDPNIYSIIAQGDCAGIFQLESSGIISFMKELKPENFEDVIAGISLYRPGPMDQIPTYIENKHHPEKIHYLHDSLKPILGVTYGCFIYQEQVMQVFRDLAGFSMGRSDLVRRAMSKKKGDVMAHEGEVFIYGEKNEKGEVIVDGCVRRGIDEETAKKIYEQMKEFAKYGFNKSHAAAYAVVACQTAWLKYYYPREFMAALMSSVMDQDKKVGRYIDECLHKGIQILPPDVNRSQNRFSVVDGDILFGLGAVKSVGSSMVDEIIRAREEKGTFESFRDFCEKVSPKGLNKRGVSNLIKCGAFDFTGIDRASLLAGFQTVMDRVSQEKKDQVDGQMNLFDLLSPETKKSYTQEDFPDVPALKESEKLAMEKEVTGLYISGHPLNDFEEVMEKMTSFNFSVTDSYEELSAVAKDQSQVQVAGLIRSIRRQLTKNKELMAFARLEDRFGGIDLVLFPRYYELFQGMLKEDVPVLIKGKICYDEEMNVSVCVERMRRLSDMKEVLKQRSQAKSFQVSEESQDYSKETKSSNNISRDSKETKLVLHFADYSQKIHLETLKPILRRFPGSTPVILYFEKESKRYLADKRLNVQPTTALITQIEAILGKDSVEVI